MQEQANSIDAELASLNEIFAVLMPGMGARIQRVSRGQSTFNDGDPLASISGANRVNIVNGRPRMAPAPPPPPRGLTDEQIKSLPKFKYTEDMGEGMFDW